jgi:hypothetical protein
MVKQIATWMGAVQAQMTVSHLKIWKSGSHILTCMLGARDEIQLADDMGVCLWL